MIRAYIVAVFTELIFGFSFIFTKGALDYVTPHQLLALRFITAAVVLTLLRILGIIKINLKNRPWGRVLLLALFQPVLYFILETTGVNLTTASEAGLMIALIPVWVTLLAALFLKEIPSPLQMPSRFSPPYLGSALSSWAGKAHHLRSYLGSFCPLGGGPLRRHLHDPLPLVVTAFSSGGTYLRHDVGRCHLSLGAWPFSKPKTALLQPRILPLLHTKRSLDRRVIPWHPLFGGCFLRHELLHRQDWRRP